MRTWGLRLLDSLVPLVADIKKHFFLDALAIGNNDNDVVCMICRVTSTIDRVSCSQVLMAVLETTLLLSLDSIPPVQAQCDNMGVVNNNCNLTGTLPEKQKQADMIRLCLEYRGRIPFPVQYNHDDGHLDKLLWWDKLPREQNENCLMDTVAKTALLDAVIDDNLRM